MSEQLEMKSLITLAAKTAPASRTDAGDWESRARSRVAERKGGFDGFLKTFLGKDKTSSGGKASGRSAAAADSDKTSRMTRQERRALRDAMDKTDAESEYIDEEIAAAAEEAARIIWNLLYPGSASTGLIAVPGNQSLAGLINLIGMGANAPGTALNGMGVGGIPTDAFGNAIETANASAEMNMDAVLASLTELLDGMPRQALRHALSGVSGLGGRYDVFAEVAAALEAEVIEVNGPAAAANPGSLLTELGMGAERQNGVFEAAETSDLVDGDGEMYELFKDFLRENFPNSSSAHLKPKQLEDIFESFARRVLGANQDSGARELLGETGGLAKLLTSDFPKGSDLATLGGGAASDKVFAWVKGNLESLLQNNTGGSGSNAGESGNGQENSAFLSGQPFSGVLSPAAAQGANAMNTPAGMSGMMEQMENIERLTEAMKMANRGSLKNITLQLAPVELGKVLLKVEARDGVVTASLRVEKAEAVAQLADNINQLRENLKAQGVELGEVDIRQHDFGYSSGGEGSERDGGGYGTESSTPAARGNAEANLESGADDTDVDTAMEQGNGLNLFA